MTTMSVQVTLTGDEVCGSFISCIFLQKGFHKYRIRYFEGYGGESFALKWQAPGDLNAKDFPAALLFVE